MEKVLTEPGQSPTGLTLSDARTTGSCLWAASTTHLAGMGEDVVGANSVHDSDIPDGFVVAGGPPRNIAQVAGEDTHVRVVHTTEQ